MVSPGLSLKAQEPGVLMSEGRRRWCLSSAESELALQPPFCPVQPSTDCVMPTGIDEVVFFTQSTYSNINFF